jgi:hypothetical protein
MTWPAVRRLRLASETPSAGTRPGPAAESYEDVIVEDIAEEILKFAWYIPEKGSSPSKGTGTLSPPEKLRWLQGVARGR